MTAPPIRYDWTGEAMVPRGRFAQEADQHFVIGESYILVAHEQRTAKSHAHYFACVTDAWENLPPATAQRYPTPDHLRKWALIRAGFRDETTFVASSKAEAVRLAAFLRPIDDTAVVLIKDAVVVRYTAKSQSMKAMGRDDFKRSKDLVLAILEQEIGVGPGELGHQHVREAA